MKRIVAVLVIFGITFAILLLATQARRRAAATRRYDRAVAAYMMADVTEARQRFLDVARDFEGLSVAALAELKVAFMAYDDGAVVDAKAQFEQFLQRHPEPVVHTPESPRRDYFGNLRIVATYFLGRIAEDRGAPEAARAWYERTLEEVDRNPGNIIIASTRDRLRLLADASEMK